MAALESLTLACDLLTGALLAGGCFFIVMGSLGLVRFPDFYSRMHAAGVTDTLGTWLVILGLVLQSPSLLVALKLLIIVAFVFFTSPTATHAIANAAFTAGQTPWLKGGSQPAAPKEPQ